MNNSKRILVVEDDKALLPIISYNLEKKGFSVREAQLIIRALNKLNYIGGDVVEVSPPFDTNNMTSLVGATIAFEILCTMTKTN